MDTVAGLSLRDVLRATPLKRSTFQPTQNSRDPNELQIPERV